MPANWPITMEFGPSNPIDNGSEFTPGRRALSTSIRFAGGTPIAAAPAPCYSQIAFDSFSGRVYPSVPRLCSSPMSPLSNRQEDDVKNIFVGNLDFHATEESLRSLFERYGTVNSARIMTDRDTGRSRGFAFVEMANEGEADQAIAALNGYTLDGRALNVNDARPKPERSFGAGGRGFGGRGGGGRREPRY